MGYQKWEDLQRSKRVVRMEKKLPHNWVETTLGDIAEWSSGGTPKRGNSNYYNGDIPWIKTGDLNNSLVSEVKEYITEEGLNNSSAKLFPKGSIGIAMYGATIGKTGVFGMEAATNQACGVAMPYLRMNTFLHYLLKSQKQAFIDKGKGGAQPNISQTVIKAHKIGFPPLPEQERIVAKLDGLFAHLEEVKTRLDKVPQLLKDFRQSVLTQAVTGKLTEEWREGRELDASRFLEEELYSRKLFWVELEREKAISKGKEFKESVIKKYKEPFPPKQLDFELPKDWETCTWDQLSNWITYGFTKPMPTVDEGIPKVTVKHVKDSRIDFESTDKTTLEAFEVLNDKDKPKKGDVLITKDGATLGRSAVVDTDIPFCIGQSVAVVWLRSSNCNPLFLNCIIQSDYIQNRIWEVARGMGMPHLSITDFRSLSIGLPTKEEQTEIVSRVEALFTKADSIEEKYTALKQKVDNLPQAVLAKAFKGELVEQLASDGNARELLEEIKKLKEESKMK